MPTELINRADCRRVIDGFNLLKRNNLHQQCFLSTGNKFRSTQIPGDIINSYGVNPFSTNDAKEFIATSTLVHCFDGWAYISSAIDAFIKGEAAIAVHMAYYAELRAALAFLGTEGILVSNHNQFCIDSADQLYIPGVMGAPKLNPNQTHAATWNIIRTWLNNTTKQSPALNYFFYKGNSFNDLINFIPHAPTSSAARLNIIKDWLAKWCFDITLYENDRNNRNILSYNINITRGSSPSSLKDKIENINKFWRQLEPGADPFQNLDRNLFALYLKTIYDRYASSSSSPCSKEDFIADFFSNAGLSIDVLLKDIFVNNKTNILIGTSFNSSIDPTTNHVLPLNIIARAILLLRLSIGGCSYLLRQSNIQKSDLSFYVEKTAKEWGLCNTLPMDWTDLWEDIDILLMILEDSINDNPPSSLYELHQKHDDFSIYDHLYTQFSRASIWGLNL